METQHTTGPWTYHEDGPDDQRRRVIWGKPSGEPQYGWPLGMPMEIAAQHKYTMPEIDANWRLMTAAPDLFEACEELEVIVTASTVDVPILSPTIRDVLSRARAAIEKATKT